MSLASYRVMLDGQLLCYLENWPVEPQHGDYLRIIRDSRQFVVVSRSMNEEPSAPRIDIHVKEHPQRLAPKRTLSVKEAELMVEDFRSRYPGVGVPDHLKKTRDLAQAEARIKELEDALRPFAWIGRRVLSLPSNTYLHETMSLRDMERKIGLEPFQLAAKVFYKP